MNDPYEILGVARDATKEQIRKAWKLLSQRNHPDRGGDPKRAAEINEAWTCLSDERRRIRYDARGEDVPVDGIDAEARSMVREMFNAGISSPHVTDLVSFVRRQLAETTSQITRNIFEQQEQVKRLAKKRDRVRTKGNATNIAHAIIDEQVRQTEAGIEHAKHGILVTAAASGLIEDYEYVPEVVQPDGTTFVGYESLQGMFR